MKGDVLERILYLKPRKAEFLPVRGMFSQSHIRFEGCRAVGEVCTTLKH